MDDDRLRLACRALLEEFETQRYVDDAAPEPRRDRQDFLRGAVAVYDRVIPLMRKALDGTLVDDDLDHSELLKEDL